MGQAKKRGSREERVEQARARDAAMEAYRIEYARTHPSRPLSRPSIALMALACGMGWDGK